MTRAEGARDLASWYGWWPVRRMGAQSEVAAKLDILRRALAEAGLAAARLRGSDWFAWVTGGGSNEGAAFGSGEHASALAEILVTEDGQWLVTSEIEAARLREEEVPPAFAMAAHPWARPTERERFIREAAGAGVVASDRPRASAHEVPLPALALFAKRMLLPAEIDRYRRVGQRAAEAATEVLQVARASWTERELAGAAADALHARGLVPSSILVAGERRVPLYRHPIPKKEPLGRIAMLALCAKGDGLHASLTRYVVQGRLTAEELARHTHVRTIEAHLLGRCRDGAPLSQIFGVLPAIYAEHGHAGAEHEHPQGGTTGYLPRELLASAESDDRLAANSAFAFTPGVRGASLEDSFLLHEAADATAAVELENLTFDPRWPNVLVAGRLRPLPLEVE